MRDLRTVYWFVGILDGIPDGGTYLADAYEVVEVTGLQGGILTGIDKGEYLAVVWLNAKLLHQDDVLVRQYGSGRATTFTAYPCQLGILRLAACIYNTSCRVIFKG